MERMKKPYARMLVPMKVVLMLGVVMPVIVALGAPATQPAGQPAPPTHSSTAVSPTQPGDVQRSSRSGRQGRGNRGGGNTPVVAAVDSSDPLGAFAVLNTRSIFVKGNQTIAAAPIASKVSSQPSSSSGASTLLANRPEASLVFNGVIRVNNEPNALIEDLGSSKVSLVRTGDLIAVGKVSAISFDDLTYDAAGKSKHVDIGEALDGTIPSSAGYAPPPTTLAPVIPATQPAATPVITEGGPASVEPNGQPPLPPPGAPGVPATPPNAGTPPAASSGGLSAEEILARMRAKRNQELGIK